MDPEAAAHLLFHSINKQTRTEAARTISYLKTGELEKCPNPFDPSRPFELPVGNSVPKLRARLEAAGLHADPDLLDALRLTIMEHVHSVFFDFFSAVDGEGVIAGADDTEVQLEIRIRDGEPLPDYLHEIFLHADIE